MLAVLQKAFEASWSLQTSSKWRCDNPALGQCSVTALVAHDILGGQIAKTEVDGAWHFYNLVDGKVLDFSQSQFGKPVIYSGYSTSRDDAFTDTSADQYQVLRERVLAFISAPPSERQQSPPDQA